MKLSWWPNLSVSAHAKLRQGAPSWRVVSIRLGLRPASSATSRSGHGGYCRARYSQSTAQATVRSLARKAVAAEKKCSEWKNKCISKDLKGSSVEQRGERELHTDWWQLNWPKNKSEDYFLFQSIKKNNSFRHTLTFWSCMVGF